MFHKTALSLACVVALGGALAGESKDKKIVHTPIKKIVTKKVVSLKEKEMVGGGRDIVAMSILNEYGIKCVLDKSGTKIRAIILNDYKYTAFSMHVSTQMYSNSATGFSYHLQLKFGKKIMDLTYGASKTPGKEYCTITKSSILCGDAAKNSKKKK